jgi:transposase
MEMVGVVGTAETAVAAGSAGGAGWVDVARERYAAVEAALHRRHLVPRVRERLEMVKGVALGQSLGEVARWSGRSERTVTRWLGAFATGGLAARADAPRGGRPPKADAAYVAALERAVATAPRELGLLFDTWTSDRLSAYLAETTGVRIAAGWVRALLARHRYRTGRPKHTLGHLQHPATKTACAEVLQAVEKKGGSGRGRVRTALPG